MKCVYFMQVMDEIQMVPRLFERADIPNWNSQIWSISIGPWGCSKMAAGQAQGTEAPWKDEEAVRDLEGRVTGWEHGSVHAKHNDEQLKPWVFQLRCSCVSREQIFDISETVSSSWVRKWWQGAPHEVIVRINWGIHCKVLAQPLVGG